MKRFIMIVLIIAIVGIGLLPVKAEPERIKVFINIETEPVYKVEIHGFMVFENHYPIRNALLGCKDCIARYKGWGTIAASYTEKIYFVGFHYEKVGDDVKITGIDCLREEVKDKSQPYSPEDIVTLPIPPTGNLADWKIYPGGWIYDPQTLSWSRTHWWRENVEFLASWAEKEYAYLVSTPYTKLIDLGEGNYLMTGFVITCLPEKEVAEYLQEGLIPERYRIGYANLLYENVNLSDPLCWHITRAKILTSRKGFEPDISVPGYNISRNLGKTPGYYWISGGWNQNNQNTFSKVVDMVKIKGIIAVTENGDVIHGTPPNQTFILEDPWSWVEIAKLTKWVGYKFEPSSIPGEIRLKPDD